MPFLSSLASAACDELEWSCLLSLSMLVISTSLPECPNAMMANMYSYGSPGMNVAASNSKRRKIKSNHIHLDT